MHNLVKKSEKGGVDQPDKKERKDKDFTIPSLYIKELIKLYLFHYCGKLKRIETDKKTLLGPYTKKGKEKTKSHYIFTDFIVKTRLYFFSLFQASVGNLLSSS